MTQSADEHDIAILRECVPLNSLSEAGLRKLLAGVEVMDAKKGKVVFKEGDSDNDAVFLISGSLLLKSKGSGGERIVEAGNENARYAVSQLKPRRYTGKTTAPSRIVRIDSAAMDQALTLDRLEEQESLNEGMEVSEFADNADAEWMMDVMRSATFEQLPAEHLTELFNRMEPVDVTGGEAVIRQGDVGDYYYVVKSGRFSVCRKGADGKVHVLAVLAQGDVFGEDALISDQPRNASVIAMGEGALARLSRKDFNELLEPSLIQYVSHGEVKSMLKQGALLLDVRTNDEFARRALRVARNVPLYRLRRELEQLDQGAKYVLCCQTGGRSKVAAFIMSQRGFDVRVLEGGLQALQPDAR